MGKKKETRVEKGGRLKARRREKSKKGKRGRGGRDMKVKSTIAMSTNYCDE